MTTLNKQIDEVDMTFRGLRGLKDAFSEKDVSVQAIENAKNKNTAVRSLQDKYQYVKGAQDGSVQNMLDKFVKAEKIILTQGASNIKSTTPNLAKYNNTIPYGVNGGTAINTALRTVDEGMWFNFFKDFIKVFSIIGKTETETLLNIHSANDIQSSLKSFCFSLSEWTQVNPVSAGMGDCKTLHSLFKKYYLDYNSPINQSEFYEQLIGNLHTCLIHLEHKKQKKTSYTVGNIAGFENEIKAYNFDPKFWFKKDNPTDADKDNYEFNGYIETGSDSYGKFFSCDGLPIKLELYNDAGGGRKYSGPLNRRRIDRAEYDALKVLYTETDDQANGRAMNKDPNTGAYLKLFSTNYDNFLDNMNIVVVKGVEFEDGGKKVELKKKYCMLYHFENKDVANPNKQDNIVDPFQYLFNSKYKSISPYVFEGATSAAFVPAAVNDACGGDLLYSQRHKACFTLIFIKFIFERLYPIQVYSTYNHIINIFGLSNGNEITSTNVGDLPPLIAAGGAVPSLAGTPIADNLVGCKNKLQQEFNKFEKYFNEYDKDGFEKILEYIKEAINSTPGDSKDIRNVAYMDVCPGFLNNPAVIRQSNINDALTTNLIGGVNFVATDALLPGDVLDNRYKVIPVLMYRYVMARMVLYYKNTAPVVAERLGDDSKTTLYNELVATNITPAKLIATYDDFRPVKQLILPDSLSMSGGSRSHKIKRPTIGGKKQRKQKGGTADNLFLNGLPKLFANRKLETFNSDNYKAAVKKYIENEFDTDYTKIKPIFDKFCHINNLPLFYDGIDSSLNIGSTINTGGTDTARPADTTNVLFDDIAKLFLYNSVITNSTKLLIHFFKNIKACLVHFIKSELTPYSDMVNVANSQSAKMIIGLEELVKEVDKLIIFLKYNTINLQDRTVIYDDGTTAGGNYTFAQNEYYIKNLFLGSGSFIGGVSGQDTTIQNYLCYQGNPSFFNFLNNLLFVNKDGSLNYKKFSDGLKFLTDTTMDNTTNSDNFSTLHAIHNIVHTTLAVGAKNPYLTQIANYIKAKPDACFGGIPLVFFDKKFISVLMRSYYILITMRIKVSTELEEIFKINMELAYSELDLKKKQEIIAKIKDTINATQLRTLAISLRERNFEKAKSIFYIIHKFVFIYAMNLIERANTYHKSIIIDKKKNKSKSLLTFNSRGGENSLYAIRRNKNKNMTNDLIKKEVGFIKEKIQIEAEFDFLITTLIPIIIHEFDQVKLGNTIWFYYYIDTHLRNFKIFLDTYLLTIGETNIPEEMRQKLQTYVGYNPDKTKLKDSFTRLTTQPLIEPQFSDPLWWAMIESRFMDTKNNDGTDSDCVYRLFIITTTPRNVFKARDMNIVDILSLASLNDERSEKNLSFTTGYRTHVGIKSMEDPTDKSKIYLETNTVIKLTGVDLKQTPIRLNDVSMKKTAYNQYNIVKKTTDRNRNEHKAKRFRQAIEQAISTDIRDLIDGKYKYFDKKTNQYKKLIPLFIQAKTHRELDVIIEAQRKLLFRPFREKIKGVNMNYLIYQMEDEKIKNLKEFRKWLYQIIVEQQFDLSKQVQEPFDNIQITVENSFKGWKITTDIMGKCARVLNIYDYIILQAGGGQNPLQSSNLKRTNLNKITTGSKKIAGFISREDLIKLMLLY